MEENESLLAWLHLRRAGFLLGATEGAGAATAPTGASGTRYGVQSGAFGLAGIVACIVGTSGAIAEGIDRQLDDGSPHSGTVRAGLTVAQPAGAYGHATQYALCISLDGSNAPSLLASEATAPASAGASASSTAGSTAGAGGDAGGSTGPGTPANETAGGGSTGTSTTSGGPIGVSTTSDAGSGSGSSSWWGGWSESNGWGGGWRGRH